MDDKLYFSYAQIHNTIRGLAEEIRRSGFTPDLMVAIGTGGFIPARILKTYLDLPILTVGLKLYDEHNRPAGAPKKIQWIDEVEKKLTGKNILLVDEVDDSRTTLQYCLTELLTHHPTEIAVGILHNKRKPKRGCYPSAVSKIFIGQEIEDRWVVYPWDAIDIDAHEELAREAARRTSGGGQRSL
ncbi:MAG TPA: phosphoribosyltransferase [Spirochaetia bacterium]|nr:phosphoribosyltransferase [Spirochaetia bacterium]